MVRLHTPLSSLSDCSFDPYVASLAYTCLVSDPFLSDSYLTRCSWYLSCLIARQGWTLLTARTDTTKLPDGRRCPAFALALRCHRPPTPDLDSRRNSGEEKRRDPAGGAGRVVREALLVIRGTTEAQDWSINMEEAPVPFVYIPTRTTPPPRSDAATAGAGTDATTAATGTGGEVQGHVHAGMHKGATGILDCYGLRTALLTLAAKVMCVATSPTPLPLSYRLPRHSLSYAAHLSFTRGWFGHRGIN